MLNERFQLMNEISWAAQLLRHESNYIRQRNTIFWFIGIECYVFGRLFWWL